MSNDRPQWEDCKVCGGDHWTKDHAPERHLVSDCWVHGNRVDGKPPCDDPQPFYSRPTLAEIDAAQAHGSYLLYQRWADLRDAVELMDTKITPFGEREDGTIKAYIVADSTWHRVLAIARGSKSDKAAARLRSEPIAKTGEVEP